MEKSEGTKYEQIGSRIEQARKREGLTQGQLAEELGYQSPTAISLIEAGKRMIKIAELERIAQILHIDLNVLLTGTARRQSDVTVKMALRSQHRDLSTADVNKIESFIEFVKAQKSGRDEHRS